MRLPRSRRLPRALGVFAGVSALLLAGLATATPAQAGDVPPAPVTEFRAPVCAGTTSQDPKQVNPGDHHGETDLTRVFGARLVSYNKGNVVPLYDTFGGADGAYPALCGTYYDPETQGPKSVCGCSALTFGRRCAAILAPEAPSARVRPRRAR